ncbi:MAG: restriction endonuclease subunit S [Acidobacteriota bacterium]|nr:restriction endonuclease subunit S [Acidobacteriota bacterium]
MGQVILSEIWGKKGAIGIVPPEGDGALCTSHFFLFDINGEALETGYLHALFAANYLEEQLSAAARGTTGYAAVRPRHLLSAKIPLPPLSAQRRIATTLDTVASKLDEIDSIRFDARRSGERFLVSLHSKLSDTQVAKLSEFLKLEEHTEPVRFGRKYPQVGIKSFGGGLFPKPSVAAEDTSYKAFNRLYSGALVLSQVKGWEGAIAVCPPELAGFFVSPEYRTFRCIPGQAIPEYLAAIVVLPWFWERLQEATRGVGARRERTRPESFLKLEVPMPTAAQQEAALPILRTLGEMLRARAAIGPLLDALRVSSLNAAIRASPAPAE